jgi:Family of unknown function (DUF6496)
MPKTSPRQRKTIGRVMHEYEHGQLKSGPGGKGGKVKNRRQAIAIALHEAGASKYESAKENEHNFSRTAQKESEGKTYQQEAEGKSHVGAWGQRESTPAMGGEMLLKPPHAAEKRRVRVLEGRSARPKTNFINGRKPRVLRVGQE